MVLTHIDDEINEWSIIMDYFREPNAEESSISVVQLLGFILLFLGVGMCIWVFFNAIHLFRNPNDAVLFEQILPFEGEGEPIEVDDSIIYLPREFYFALAFIATIFTLSIAGFIGGAFISGGVGLINPTGERLEKKFERRMKEIERKVSDSFKGS